MFRPLQGMHTRVLALVLIATTPVALATATDSASGAPASPTAGTASFVQKAPQKGDRTYRAGRYIVSFTDEPLATYDGSKSGFAATRPAPEGKLRANSAVSKKWKNHLVDTHDAALAKVGAKKIYDYTVTNNGVAAQLTAAQAKALSKMSGVAKLERDVARHVDTTLSPAFLGLSRPGGLWSKLGGPKKAGAGVVVGVIDTGIWPESTAFAGSDRHPGPRRTGRASASRARGSRSSTCNDKLIGARYYVDGFGKQNIAPDEYLSPRDGDGHGSHTASTAAGNNGTTSRSTATRSVPARAWRRARRSRRTRSAGTGKPGVADGCFNSDSVEAINDAVADGVDVLNYSIGGTTRVPVPTRSRRPSCRPRAPASSSRTRLATAAPGRARSTTRHHG